MQHDITQDELAQFAAGECTPQHAQRVESHIANCAQCRDLLNTLQEADALLATLRHDEPSVDALYAVRQAVSSELDMKGTPQIMTLDEVAEFLRIPTESLETMAGELPAFLLGGEIRVRRENPLPQH